MAEDELWERGLRIRRQVVGDAHVDRSLAETDDFSRPLQELVVRYAWGEVWGGRRRSTAATARCSTSAC